MTGESRTCRIVVTLVFCIGCPLAPAARVLADAEEADPSRFVSFATIDLRVPTITGSIWMPCDKVQTLSMIDTDGDFQYSQDELNEARVVIEYYLKDAFFFLWHGRIQPVQVERVDIDRRPGLPMEFFKATFRVTDYPPRQPLVILCRALRDMSPLTRTEAHLTRDGQSPEVFVFGPGDYYTTERAEAKIPTESPFRPPQQRGRTAMFQDVVVEAMYAVPEGAIRLYFLQTDRFTPYELGLKELTAKVGPKHGDTSELKPLTLKAHPLAADKPGKSSCFQAAVAEWKDETMFNMDVDITFTQQPGRLIFDFPAIRMGANEKSPDAAERFACPNLCAGVQTNDRKMTCPRCGAKVIPLHGANVPLYGDLGPHGGQMRDYRDGKTWVEALLAAKDEFRLYHIGRDFRTIPMTSWSGTVNLSTDEHFQQTIVEMVMKPSDDKSCMAAEIPATVRLPVRARCIIDDPNLGGPDQTDFLIRDLSPQPKPATTAPAGDHSKDR